MKIRPVLAVCVSVLLAVGACFDSLVNGTCSPGFAWSRGACVAQLLDDAGTGGDGAELDARLDDGGAGADTGPGADARPDAGGGSDEPDAGGGSDAPDAGGSDAGIDAGPDAGIDAAIDAGTDAPADAAQDAMVDAQVCVLPTVECAGVCVDTTSDPDNCGGCGHVCPSGVCSNSVCAGALRGHVVAIGHDYRSYHAAMARVLGNSAALGMHFDLGIARLRGSAAGPAVAGTSSAIASSLASLVRPWHSVTLPAIPTSSALVGVDVVVVDAQLGNAIAAEALGASWRTQLADFLVRGGVVVVLEGAGGVSYRFAIGAGLYTIAAPIDATGQLALVTDGADATTQQVTSPYLAESTSATLPGTQRAAITALTGGTLVFHFTR